MSDHHVDSMDINYSEAAKHYLQTHGCYISNAPDINHKPGNDLISDWYYPFPVYPDYRFADAYENDKEIKFPTEYETETKPSGMRFPCDFEILSEDMLNLKNLPAPVVNDNPDDGWNFINRVISPYTGLVIQARQKKAYDISFVKPYYENDERKLKLEFREIITGHFLSVAAFDGWNYHIFRGLCVAIPSVPIPKKNNRPIYTRSVPYGKCMTERKLNKQEDDSHTNVKLVLDVSKELHGEYEIVPLGQIIDIEPFDYIYDFTIYEPQFSINHDDWFIGEDKDTNDLSKDFVYVPIGEVLPQKLYHPVIEHQGPIGYKIH
jgi:hypothetical protein